ncbi:MAG: UbiA family prenyltransferase [Proteobacteria bacterium]|nr:UbiA family prenyltransferase [Pseudomonadota bacterium]MBU1586004.1 UbiA family prenyltransferase [Pseudomonadota bacterium]MBU2454064.1 UbiA family prenyltransferase [Pseudomonadota bacterium]MBU2630083.1 UbiA family prenyltransferase [Pseudomonadota bacterium]
MNGNRIILLQTVVSDSLPAVRPYLEMLKLHLCLYISLSAVFGHVMARQSFSFESLLLGIFVLILACGSAVLNNIQDKEYDKFFLRTCYRSLPQKKVPVFHAKLMAILLTGCGLLGLLFFCGPAPFFWGGMAFFCYNGLYTPLKKRSLLAIVPGSLCGMLPPLIGWTAAGKNLSDPSVLMLLSIFGLWQIPHFFIILLKQGMDHSKADELKRFPCFTRLFSKKEIMLQTLIWTSLYSLSLLLFLMNGAIKNHILSMGSGLNAVMIPFIVSAIVLRSREWNLSVAFTAINLSMLFFMGAGICDKFFPG